MIDLIATAKCGLLDNMFLATFWLPMMPTMAAVTAFTVAHGMGRGLAHVFGFRPTEVRTLWPITRIVLIAIVALLVVAIAFRGIAYPVFLARMVKDAYYCSYLEIGRDLQSAHWIVFVLMFMAHCLCAALFDDRRFRNLEPVSLRVACIFGYVSLGIAGYLMAIALDAVLVPLTVLFILPFAYCGIGILARHR
jgi:hypothetical protein